MTMLHSHRFAMLLALPFLTSTVAHAAANSPAPATGPMATVGMVMLAAGAAIGLSAFIWLLVRAFKVGLGWGLGTLLFPPTALAFFLTRREQATQPFLLVMLGIMIGVVGFRYTGKSIDDFWPRKVETAAISAPPPPAPRPANPDKPSLAEQIKQQIPLIASAATKAEPVKVDARIGEPLVDVLDRLGRPKARLDSGLSVALQYPGYRLISDNGVTVTDIIRDSEQLRIHRVNVEPPPSTAATSAGTGTQR